ncbi:MAG: class I SAM-dependent rRNA methyltransferase [Candidatus Omnitrophica bacterium]|nr:class I SAM-dependent rRNA methyltransferase [Candidatus Omnitrophota bacterium]
MNENRAILKKGKDKPVKNRHHWIFSGAIKHLPDFENGSVLDIYSAENEFLGQGYFNKKTSIAARMISFDDRPVGGVIKENILKAIECRSKFFNKDTNAYRLVNGEGDFLPGLIVDKYNGVLVVQISTLGMEKLKNIVIDILVDALRPECIYEKSDIPSRRQEGMDDYTAVLYGQLPDALEILENGLRFIIDIKNCQKTGFFLDQRETRNLTGAFAKNKKVLNCFSYTGAFSVYALKGAAVSVDSVDEQKSVLELAKKNLQLNGFDADTNKFYAADVFEFLRRDIPAYDFIILDPPAFAKRKTDVVAACRGYKDINRLAMQNISAGGLLLTCSCSFFVNEGLFQKVIFEAAKDAGRNARIIQKHRLAYDHPINIYHPEGDYLKSFLLYID